MCACRYEQAARTGRDSFLFGPSGYGYNWPSLIQPAAKQQQFADDTARDAAALEWPGYIHWDYATIDGDAIKRYIGRLNSSTVGRDNNTGRPAIQAAFINFPTSLFIEEDHVGKETQCLRRIYIEKRSFYKDRLGTNIRETTQKNACVSLGDVELFRCHQVRYPFPSRAGASHINR